ncbi:MAG: hypothetical protein Kilf2KO_40020 [Rhodospirillales bacterium]
MTPQVLTANCLLSGAIVYLSQQGCWIGDLERARIAETPEDLAELQVLAAQAEAQQLVVSSYLVPVAIEAGHARPLGQREIVRAGGPTVGTDLTPVTREA